MGKNRRTIKLFAALLASGALVIAGTAVTAFADTTGTDPGDTNTGNTNVSVGVTTQVALDTTAANGVVIGANGDLSGSVYTGPLAPVLEGQGMTTGLFGWTPGASTTGLVRICVTCRR